MRYVKDLKNSKKVTSGDATTTSPWVGEWVKVLSQGYTTIRIAAASGTDDDDFGGTFTFEHAPSESVALSIEQKTLIDFATPKVMDILVVDEYFRLKFTPNQAMGSNTLTITTLFGTDGAKTTTEADETNEAILEQLKLINLHLEFITGAGLKRGDR